MSERSVPRRRFLAGGAVGAASLLASCDCGEPAALVGPGPLQKSRELKMVTTWPKDFPGLGAGAEHLAKTITEMSGGALRVNVYAANELVPAFESFDAVSTGAADLYHGVEYYWIGKSPAFAFFTAVPFGMTAPEIMAWTEFGGGQELWDELAARFNVKPFAAGNTGHQLAGWYKKEINSLDDLKGMKIRMPGIGGEVLRRVGASAVALSGGEIYQALQNGQIDGTEWVGPYNDLAFGFYREADYYYWPGIHEPGAQGSCGVNLDLWNDFSLQEKAIVENACRALNARMLADFVHNNAIALRQLTERHGVQLRQMPQDVLEALARETKTVLEETAASDAFTTRVFESYKASLTRSGEWGRISDEAYMAARRQVFTL